MRTKIGISPSRIRRQRGAAMIETALSFSAFLLLTFGLMEFSMAVYAYNFCSYSAREASRFASVHGEQSPAPTNPDQIRSLVRAQAIGLIANSVNVETRFVPDAKPGSHVVIRVSYAVNPLVGLALGNVLNVSSTSQTTIVH